MFIRRQRRLESESALLQRAVTWPDHPTLSHLCPETLRNITRTEGIDFATALLYDRFIKSAQHGEFIRQITTFQPDSMLKRKAVAAKIVIVPGALYRERPELGGDGRVVQEVARQFGYQIELIPLTSFGSVTENARRIGDWFRQRRSERFIVVSLSKGGADFKVALASPDASVLYQNVIVWVNVCGPLNGTPMADWILADRWRTSFVRTQCWLQGREFRLITDLAHSSSGLLHTPVVPLPSMQLISLVGFPLQRHMTSAFSRFCQQRLAIDGPNDGTILLADLVTWPGKVFPAWGLDHYFCPEPEAKKLVASLLHHLAEESHSDCRSDTKVSINR